MNQQKSSKMDTFVEKMEEFEDRNRSLCCGSNGLPVYESVDHSASENGHSPHIDSINA